MEEDAEVTHRRVRRDAQRPPHSPGRHIRSKSSSAAQSITPPTTASSKHSIYASSTAIPQQTSVTTGRKSLDEKRHFVGNVGSGGTLYLEPSRVAAVNVFQTPPGTAYGDPSRVQAHPRYQVVVDDTEAGAEREHETGSRNDNDMLAPPMVAGRAGQYGLLDLRIPHYRLGTPRFSDMGTAYLHSSICTTSTDDNRLSALSQQAYDELFPTPPVERETAAVHNLHPSSAARRKSHKSSASRSVIEEPNLKSLFDAIEVNPLNEANVRFTPDGHLAAATVPRLIAQITSPRFLDYELISDFFLTYRGFVSSQELLSLMIQRMQWAFDNDTDAGRIVRVRTFVAIRHWILNYFADDFVPSFQQRRQFCIEVNQLARGLAKRPGRGIGDLNIIAELKKCWRRTSAMFWPVEDALESSPLSEIVPGGPDELGRFTTRRETVLTDDQALLVNPMVALDKRTNQRARVVSFQSLGSSGILSPRGSIPASPLSDDSLQVLSCSIPFLQKVRPDAAAAERRAQKAAPRPAVQRQNSLTRQMEHKRRPSSHHKHRRAESEALPSRRAPEKVSQDDVPSITLTGGLVRGLLLQPCPAMVQSYAPRSPPLELGPFAGEDYFDEVHGVRRIVDDMRRALSSRKTSSEVSNSTHSRSGSRTSNNVARDPRATPVSVDKASISSTPRKDVLAARIQRTYGKHFLEDEVMDLPNPRFMGSFAARLGSGITAGSRSIVIVDATSLPAQESSTSAMSDKINVAPLFPSIDEAQRLSNSDYYHSPRLPPAPEAPSIISDDEMLNPFIFPMPNQRSLESAPSTHSDMTTDIPLRQIRRRPGGDLRTAEHVRELDVQEHRPSPDDSLLATPILRPQTQRVSSAVLLPYPSSQLHDRPSFQSAAGRLSKARTASDSAGGVEAALATLEGKPSTRKRHSGLSWLELPKDEAFVQHDILPSDPGLAFVMVEPYSAADQAYRISRPDYSEDTSIQDFAYRQSKSTGSGQRPMSMPLDFTALTATVPSSDTGSRRVLDPTFSMNHRSFLLDDNESLSDISSAQIEHAVTSDRAEVRSFYLEEPDEPLDDRLASRSSNRRTAPLPYEHQPLRLRTDAVTDAQSLAGPFLTPITSPRRKGRSIDEQGHYSFVMGFEAAVIAEQLCIIEKDALDEVDWKDLITLNWRHTPSTIRNWADYLKHEASNGIDLVVARFNLVVKWVVSQCVLTESIRERAQCITKFIHIAAHCLQLRNYASMAQISLALLSSDLAKLRKTWTLVHPTDMHTLDYLETLCRPQRNFANLRAEMENSSLAEGCIPFIGLYTHDLMYNAQKPARLEQIVDGRPAPLINFERYQTAAMITKSLLRLLDASSQCIFRPHHEALSRCLWLAALEDVDINEVSADLE